MVLCLGSTWLASLTLDAFRTPEVTAGSRRPLTPILRASRTQGGEARHPSPCRERMNRERARERILTRTLTIEDSRQFQGGPLQRVPVIVIPALAAILASPTAAIAQHQQQIQIDE